MTKLLPLALLFLALSCKTNKGAGDSASLCNTIATVKDYTGLDGCTFLLILEDGTKWRPNSIVDENFKLKDGQKIKFGYKDAESMISICMAESKTIDITCIEEIASNNDSDGMPYKPEKIPCVETTNPAEVAWMAELVKQNNPISITRYNYLDGFAYYLEGGPRSWLYDCQGTFLCDIPGKIMNDCVRKVNQLDGKLEIWSKE